MSNTLRLRLLTAFAVAAGSCASAVWGWQPPPPDLEGSRTAPAGSPALVLVADRAVASGVACRPAAAALQRCLGVANGDRHACLHRWLARCD